MDKLPELRLKREPVSSQPSPCKKVKLRDFSLFLGVEGDEVSDMSNNRKNVASAFGYSLRRVQARQVTLVDADVLSSRTRMHDDTDRSQSLKVPVIAVI